MNLPIIRCDVCPAESTTSLLGWQRFQYRFSLDVDASPIDVCPTCSQKLRQAIGLVMAGKDLAVDEPQSKKLDTILEMVSRLSPSLVEVDVDNSPPESLAAIERRHILATFDRAKGNRALAARQLGIERSTLYRKLQSYGIQQTPERELAVAQ